MENQNSNKVVIVLFMVIVAILAVLCVLFATGTIEFKSNEVTNNTNNNNNQQNNNTSNGNANNNYAEWMNYILKQNITNIEINRTRYVGDNEEDYDLTVNLTVEQLKSVFSKLMNYNLVKEYLQGSGFTYGDILTISYSINGTNYDVELLNDVLSVSYVDDGLLTALENSNHTVENEEQKDMEGVYFNYYFQGYSESIFDEFFK